MELKRLKDLCAAIAKLETPAEAQRFLIDLCTPDELASMAGRWGAARLLDKGVPYREIYAKTGVSTATVTRVARALVYGKSGYRLILDRIKK